MPLSLLAALHNPKYWASSISPISNHIEKARQNKILGKTLLPPPPSPKHEEPKECILKTIETIVVPASWTTFEISWDASTFYTKSSSPLS